MQLEQRHLSTLKPRFESWGTVQRYSADFATCNIILWHHTPLCQWIGFVGFFLHRKALYLMVKTPWFPVKIFPTKRTLQATGSVSFTKARRSLYNSRKNQTSQIQAYTRVLVYLLVARKVTVADVSCWYFFSRTQQQAESHGETPHLKLFIYWPNLFQHNAELGWQGLTDIYGVRVTIENKLWS